MIRNVQGIKESIVAMVLAVLLIIPCFGEAPGTSAKSTEKSGTSLTTQDRDQSRSVFVAGDAVSVSTLPDSASLLNHVFPIDDRGYVELPIYGKFKITDMSKEQFVQFLRDRFKDYLRYPDLQVKPLIRLSVLGAVPRPGLYYFDPEGSLWEVMYLVGGTADENGLKDMRWERNGGPIEKNLIPYLQSGISLRRLGFRSGDQLWVKTLGKPSALEKIARVLPFLTAGIAAASLIILIDDRRTR